MDGGKFIIGGDAFSPTTRNDFFVGRMNADGSPDTTFGDAGFTITDFNGLEDLVFAIAVQPDGKIVAAGDSNTTPPIGSGGNVKWAVARYDTKGNLDPSFGSGGKEEIDPTPTAADGLRAVAVEPDGKIAVGGFIGELFGIQNFTDGPIGGFGLGRLLSNGSLDTTFGSGGIVKTMFDGGGDGGRALLLPNDDAILVAGSATTSHARNFALAQYKG